MHTSPSRLPSLLASCVLACSSAWAAPFTPGPIAIDRASNALVTVLDSNGQHRETSLLLDASGRIVHCRSFERAAIGEIHDRRDADGFLVEVDATLERWDAQGGVEWVHTFEARPGLASRTGLVSAPDGGAVLIEEFRVPGNLLEARLVRIDAQGNERWRTPLFAYASGLAGYVLSVDRQHRVHFAASAHRDVLSINSPGTVRLGMVAADGRLAWLHAEAHGAGAQSVLFDDGAGDLWWLLGTHWSRDVPYRPSQLTRWTPWGMPLASFTGPALVAGAEIRQAAMGDREAIWLLAESLRDVELVRVGTGGLEARHLLDARIEQAPTPQGFYTHGTYLSVADDSAWVVITRSVRQRRPEQTVERYTRAGRSWLRRLGDGLLMTHLQATAAGDARALFEDDRQELWLASLSARRGEEQWRTSLDPARQCRPPAP